MFVVSIGPTWLHQSESISYLLALFPCSLNYCKSGDVYYNWFPVGSYCCSWREGWNKSEWISCTLL